MGKHTTQPSSDVPGDAVEPSVFVFGTIADTTWRLFVPTIGFTLIGAWLDAQLHSLPWCMIAGIVLGSLLAIALVRRQLHESRGDR